MFGGNYNKFQEKQKKSNPKDLNKWLLDQNLPLSAYVFNNESWEKVDYFNLIGPMAFKEDVLSLDVSSYGGKDIQIKLESGFLFWEIDYVGIDFSAGQDIATRIISLDEAVTGEEIDVRGKMLMDDKEYYIQPKVGDQAILKFAAPKQTDEMRSIFLHSKGYYLILRDQEGRPEKKKLRKFREEGRFPKYSKELYQEFLNNRN